MGRGVLSVSEKSRRVRARRREKIGICFLRRHKVNCPEGAREGPLGGVRRRKHFSDRKCGICPPEADKSCARRTASCSKKWLCHFFEQNAVRRAQDLSASSGQIPHLRPEKCFLRRTPPRGPSLAPSGQFTLCRRRKQVSIFSRLRARTLRSFFQTMSGGPAGPPLFGLFGL